MVKLQMMLNEARIEDLQKSSKNELKRDLNQHMEDLKSKQDLNQHVEDQKSKTGIFSNSKTCSEKISDIAIEIRPRPELNKLLNRTVPFAL